MLVAIISDVHDNLPNLNKVLTYCQQNHIQEIICCGDLASQETLDYLANNFSGKVYFVFGNMDQGHYDEKKFIFNKIPLNYKNVSIFPNQGEIEISSYKIAFTHFPDKAQQLCQTQKYDYVFYGHTHKPWEEKIKNCLILNPGNVANQIYPPTFAVWNTTKNEFQLIRINQLEL